MSKEIRELRLKDRPLTFLDSPISQSALMHRPRRLRRTSALREMVRETNLTAADFIHPIFVHHHRDWEREVLSLPGVFQLGIDRLPFELEQISKLGIRSVLLFGIPETKDALGSTASSDDGVVQTAIREIKRLMPELVVIGDLCFCEYTDHGHCGPVVEDHGIARVDNDRTLELLIEQALSHARAGVDVIAPSGMMDGFVAVLRAALDAAGFTDISILAYSAKFASAFYGPFREAADSTPQFGDRATYQMDSGNRREAEREIRLDLQQGADMVMVKPALAYLDVIRNAREISDVPVVAYNVSGEYAMVKAVARNGWVDERRIVREILTSIKRAGADLIISYHAKQFLADSF